MDFNEAHLHEATLNLHTHAWIFSHLSIASVVRKVSKLQAFEKKKTRHTWRTRSRRKTGKPPRVCGFLPKKVWIKWEEWAGALLWWRCQLPVDNSGLLRCTASRRQQGHSCSTLVIFWLCGTYSWWKMKIWQEHLTLTHTNAACHQLMLLTGGKKFTHACEGSNLPHASTFNWNTPCFHKKKMSYFSNRPCMY